MSGQSKPPARVAVCDLIDAPAMQVIPAMNAAATHTVGVGVIGVSLDKAAGELALTSQADDLGYPRGVALERRTALRVGCNGKDL